MDFSGKLIKDKDIDEDTDKHFSAIDQIPIFYPR